MTNYVTSIIPMYYIPVPANLVKLYLAITSRDTYPADLFEAGLKTAILVLIILLVLAIMDDVTRYTYRILNKFRGEK